jgi:ribosomal protein L11 methyltransferase
VAAAAEACAIGVPDFAVEQLPLRDWVVENLKDFAPFTVGRFFIYGADYEGAVPAAKIGLRVPAGAAFGSGEHGSTKGCLLALDWLSRRRRFRDALDMGCGSGILALAAVKLWAAPVAAFDVDPIAARQTAVNARGNGAGALIRAGCAAGYRARALHGRRFDLICANILARPLSRMAKDLARHLAPGGVTVLSGLIESDGNRVIAAHRAHGLRLRRRITVDGWLTLVMEKVR